MKALTIVAGALVLCLPAAAQEQAELSEHHGHLKQFAGTWTAKTTFMTGADGSSEVAEAEEKVKLAKGGFWASTEFKGEMAGMKFLGAGMLLYDLKKKKYVSTWIDSMSSALTVYEGTCDNDGKVFTLTGKTTSPELGGDVTMKLIHTIKDEKSRTLLIAMVGPEGNDIPLGTVDYTRAEKKKKREKKDADGK